MIADSGGADTTGSEMLMTSAVAMLFSCSCWDKTAAPVPLNSVGRATQALVMGKRLCSGSQGRLLQPSPGNTTQSGEKFPSDSGIPATTPRLYPAPCCMNDLDTKPCNKG